MWRRDMVVRSVVFCYRRRPWPRQRVSTTEFPHGKTQPFGLVTISVGVSTFTKNIDSPENIIAAADRALYQAKSLGKDRIEFYRERES